MTSSASLRLFFAVELPEEVRSEVAAHIACLREDAPERGARWERKEKLHLTLKFLGAVERGRVESLRLSVAERVAATQPFTLSLEGTGTFPPRVAPQILWLGVSDPSERLAALQTLIEEASERCGFPREQRSFHPHLTLARLKHATPSEARRLARRHIERGFRAGPFAVRDLALVRSELRPAGSVYTILARLPLRG